MTSPPSPPAVPAARSLRARVPWWAAVFLVALALRAGFLLLVDEPLLYRHQYNYFRGMLLLAEHPRPWHYILHSDEWRQWNGFWTNAPLYYLFGAAILALGKRLVWLQLAQCALDALTAVLVGALGRRAAGRSWGAWAGVAYALYWPAVELPSRTMTENLHTLLVVAGLSGLLASAPDAGIAEAGRGPRSGALAGGLAFGLGALVRAVGFAFVPVAAAWRLIEAARSSGGGWRRSVRRALPHALLFAGGAALMVAPWAVRNRMLLGDPSPIETVSLFNLWTDNTFANETRYERQRFYLADAPTHAERRKLAVDYAWRGIRANPRGLVDKAWVNFTHFIRPDGLWVLLGAEQPAPAWRHAARILLEDLPLCAAVVLFLTWVAGGRASPARSLLALWCAYYLFMVIVVFHNEIRYRSAVVPFLLAGAAGGVATLTDPARRRRAATLLGAAAGLAVVGLAAGRFVPLAERAVLAEWRVQPAQAAVSRGDLREAESWAFAAASASPSSARPWLHYGRWLAWAGRPTEAIEAYRRAESRAATPWIPRVVLPRLLAEAGRSAEAEEALRAAHAASWDVDPWLFLETAWRELPPPRADVIELARYDYGAARGFLHPMEGSRWSRGRAELRLMPLTRARRYRVTLEMSSPPPAPDGQPTVAVTVRGGDAARFTLSPEPRSYSFETGAASEVLIVELRAPVWSRWDQPAEQGIRVHRMTVAPAGG